MDDDKLTREWLNEIYAQDDADRKDFEDFQARMAQRRTVRRDFPDMQYRTQEDARVETQPQYVTEERLCHVVGEVASVIGEEAGKNERALRAELAALKEAIGMALGKTRSSLREEWQQNIRDEIEKAEARRSVVSITDRRTG